MRCKWMCLLCAVVMLLSGCVANVESLIVPPTPAGDQQAIKQALDNYVLQTYDTTNYLLHYPTEGAYTSAFIALPGDPDRAIAFYRLRGEQSGNIRVNLLCRTESGWASAGEVEGLNTAVEEVGFADLDGDGLFEVLLGWSVYNSNDRSLMLCQIGGGAPRLQTVPGMYTSWHTVDMTGDGVSELVLLRYGAEGRNTARLYALRDFFISEMGSVRIDGYIRGITGFTAARPSEAISGLYIDAVTEGGAHTTELLCWDGEQLTAPFYSPESDTSALAARELNVQCGDVDGDGIAEFPVTVLLEGYEEKNAPSYAWRVDWCVWDAQAQMAVCKESRIVCERWGYTMRLHPAWAKEITTRYDAGQGVLWVLRGAGDPVMAVSCAKKLPSASSYSFKEWYRDRSKGLVYGVWLSEDEQLVRPISLITEAMV